MSNKRKYLVYNILLTLVSVIPFWIVLRSAQGFITLDRESLPPGLTLLSVFVFLSVGVSVAFISAKRAESMTQEGSEEGAAQYSKKIRRFYAIITVILWALGFYCAIALPGYFGYLQRGYNVQAREALGKLNEAQKLHKQVSGIFTDDTVLLGRFGLQIEPDVTLIVKAAGKNCWNATARHKKSPDVYEADCSGSISQVK